MSGSNGYVDLSFIDHLHVVEDDFEIDGVGKFRVRGLTQENIREITLHAREAVDSTFDGVLERYYYVAIGLVKPDLGSDGDLSLALERARKIGQDKNLFDRIYSKILTLTYRDPKEAYRDFFASTGSAPSAEGTPSSSST